MVLPGWIVSRAIPYDTLAGLITGQYKLYGGVIRWAAGTPNAGQIVTHLMPVAANSLNSIPGLNFIPGIVANIQLGQLREISKQNTHQLMQISGQIKSLSQVNQQILQIATGTAFLSGLGLTVSCIGFASVYKKLNTIDTTLKKVQKDIQAIKYFLESSERARLHAALNALLKLDSNTAIEHRHAILHNSRNTLAEINMRYRELLSEADTIETAMSSEEYFTLTALALVRCTAELEMLDIAYKEIEEINIFWKAQAKRIAKQMLVGKYPERFLATDFYFDVPVTELVQWLDFVYVENKGLRWIDELRFRISEFWYSQGWFKNDDSGLNKNIGIGLDKEKQILIPALKKLVARSNVFEDYVSQYQLFEAQKIKPSNFEHKLNNLPESELVEGYLILEPIKKEVWATTL